MSLSENNELNKLLKYVARSLFKRTTVGATLAKLKTIEMYLSDVTYEEFSGSRASAIKLNRLNNNYSAALKIAQLFVRGFGIQSRVGHDENFGILFDMNRLFEEFITVTCAHFAPRFWHRRSFSETFVACHCVPWTSRMLSSRKRAHSGRDRISLLRALMDRPSSLIPSTSCLI